jgi:hypothetical protein
MKLILIILAPFLALLGSVRLGTAAEPLTEALSYLKTSKVARIDVIYAPNPLETSSAVDPEHLHIIAKQGVMILQPEKSTHFTLLVEALEHAQAEQRPADARWGALHLNLRYGAFLYDSRSNLLCDIYLDVWGERGTISGAPYRFTAELKRWLSAVEVSKQ